MATNQFEGLKGDSRQESRARNTKGFRSVAVDRQDGSSVLDEIVVEEPLEIRLGSEPLAVTMRTPGNDHELAAGFLLSEGVIEDRDEIVSIDQGDDPLDYDPDQVIAVELTAKALDRWRRRGTARREFRALSGCGLCGKAALRDVYQQLPTIEPFSVDGDLIASLPDRMSPHQLIFAATGGLHAAALFDEHAELRMVREDVGRHNAVDKIIGASLLAGLLPLHRHLLVVSSRAGFEIVQKAAMASIPVVAAVGAASNLAVEIASHSGVELFSFVSSSRWNRHIATPRDLKESPRSEEEPET